MQNILRNRKEQTSQSLESNPFVTVFRQQLTFSILCMRLFYIGDSDLILRGGSRTVFQLPRKINQ